MSNGKIQAAAAGRPFVVGPPAVVAAMKIGGVTSLAGVRAIC
jgi:hypothetical protein